MTGLPCPNCGSELAFLDQYNRHYCYACGHYAPEGFGDRGAKRCPMCTGILSYVTQYDRYYCFRCNAYPPEGVFMETKVEAVSPVTVEPIAEAQTALVLVEPPNVEQPKAEEPAPVQTEPVETSVSTEPAPRAEHEELAAEEVPSEEPVAELAKPPLVRAEMLEAKKLALLDLCKAYDLDPTGTKEQLRERLLSYLDELEAQQQPEEIERENSEEVPEEDAKEPVVEPTAVAPAQAEPVVEPVKIPQKLITAAPRMVPEIPKREMASSYPFVASGSAAVVETPPASPTVVEPSVSPAVAPDPRSAVSIPVAPTVPAARVEHPCPTCHRELTYIPQYNRWYCYSCRAYAPKARSKFACPNCGAALRWISQYERWWCDACRRYAPSDLPRPERASLVGTSSVAVSRAVSTTPTIVHRHSNPGTGIGLVGFGMVLFVMYEILVDLPSALSSGGPLLGSDVAFGLRFFAFVFVAIGAILGLSAVRDRR